MQNSNIAPHHRWFPDARYGLFVHWGPYAQYGRGEQVLLREQLPQAEYAEAALNWNPTSFDARAWAQHAVAGGFNYAVLTARHHDGYCLWNTARHEYSSWHGAPKRDFVREYVEAFREAGLKVGLYYSLADWRVPAYFNGPEVDAEAFDRFLADVHAQVEELLTHYGRIDVFWFDGAWPHSADLWRSRDLIAMMRRLQPHILINNRLGYEGPNSNEEATGGMKSLGDFGTPEHHITAEEDRLWESCQTSTSRLWGYTTGEHWRTPKQLLDFLCEAAHKGGNLLLNVGPDGNGSLPDEFVERSLRIGEWLRVNGEAVYGTTRGDVVEFVTRGWQTVSGNNLYLIIRFWDGRPELRLHGLASRILRANLLTTGQELAFKQSEDVVYLQGLPASPPDDLFPVIKLECESPPSALDYAVDRLWGGDPRRFIEWVG